jgi:hypothetical protein
MAALLFEAAIMLIAMYVSARWIIRRFDVRPALPATIAIGLVALSALLRAEITGGLWLRDLSLGEYVASFADVPGIISLVMFLLFAAMPTLVRRSTRGRLRAIF